MKRTYSFIFNVRDSFKHNLHLSLNKRANGILELIQENGGNIINSTWIPYIASTIMFNVFYDDCDNLQIQDKLTSLEGDFK